MTTDFGNRPWWPAVLSQYDPAGCCVIGRHLGMRAARALTLVLSPSLS